MTDLEMAGRALVAREPLPLTPIEQIRARATGLAARRARRRRVVAAVAAAAVLIGLAAWAVARSTTTREHVATTPAPTTSVAPSTTAPLRATTTSATPPRGPNVTAARITSADLGMAATYDPATARSRLWLTRDSRTWHDVTPRGGIAGTIEDVFALDPLHLWATSWYGRDVAVTVWRSADDGLTWTHAVVGTHSDDGTSHLQFVDPQHGWVEESSLNGPVASLSRTTDGGLTWTKTDARLPELGDVSFYTPTDGYLGTSPSIPFVSALYVTHDAGRSWGRVTIDLGIAGLPNPSWSVIYGVPTFVDNSSGVLPVTLANEGAGVVEWWTTSDAGATWQLRTPPSAGLGGSSGSATEPKALLSSVTGPHVWWAVTYYRGGTRTYVTLDAGSHWSDTDDAQLDWPSPHWFGAANADVAWMLGNGLYATNDGGHTWVRIDPGP